MDPITAKLLEYGIMGIMVIGLVIALKTIREDAFKRETTLNNIITAKESKIEGLLTANLEVLKQDIETRVKLMEKMADVQEVVSDLQHRFDDHIRRVEGGHPA